MIKIRENKAYIEDVCCLDLKKHYGTPLYVYSVGQMKKTINELKKAFTSKYPNTIISYASKAFICKAMCQFIEKEGLNLDVVSGGELYTALQAGFDPSRIEFNGNNKLYEELEMAVKNNVGKIIVDGEEELEYLIDLSHKYRRKINLLFRVTPGVEVHTHKYITTAKEDTKFGFPLDEVLEQVKKVSDEPYLEFIGYHFHIGSQLFESQPYVNALNNITPLLKETYEICDEIKELNVGGGFGINYTDEERKSFSYFLDPIMNKIDEIFNHFKKERPVVTIEPGRSIVGEAGYTLYTVGSIKNIEGVRKYVSIDGGMTDNIRPALYGAKYDGVVANCVESEKKEVITICGKCCESGDIIREDIELPEVRTGDLILIRSTGAYGYSMSSNYNQLLKPAVVFVEGKEHKLVVKRQSLEELIMDDLEV